MKSLVLGLGILFSVQAQAGIQNCTTEVIKLGLVEKWESILAKFMDKELNERGIRAESFEFEPLLTPTNQAGKILCAKINFNAITTRSKIGFNAVKPHGTTDCQDTFIILSVKETVDRDPEGFPIGTECKVTVRKNTTSYSWDSSYYDPHLGEWVEDTEYGTNHFELNLKNFTIDVDLGKVLTEIPSELFEDFTFSFSN